MYGMLNISTIQLCTQLAHNLNIKI